ncbi:MAG: HD family hydrolase, partial [Hyphomicrobiaceae bacterium]|nr:HD family hydrolase [Hyphomicrobiaceae bacterium]
RMLSGRRLDLLNPDPADIEFSDIAHGLARVARWNGQTVGAHAFSVAQHTVIVEEIAASLPFAGRTGIGSVEADGGWSTACRRAALLHDAAEYVIGDLISPFKSAIGLDYRAFELRLLGAIHTRFGLPAELPAEVAAHIKLADRIAAFYEATRLAGFTESEAATYFGQPPVGWPSGLPDELRQRLETLTPESAETAQNVLLKRFVLL